MQDAIRSARVRWTDNVVREGSTEWRPLSTVDELVGPAVPQRFYARASTGTVGPLGIEEIVAAVRDGRIESDGLVCPVGEKEWRPLSKFESLRSAIAPPPPPVLSEAVPPPPMVGFASPPGSAVQPAASPADSRLRSEPTAAANPSETGTPQALAELGLRVWSPQPAVFAGLLFSPIFTSVLLSLNWRAMGDARRARLAAAPGALAVLWILVSCAVGVIAADATDFTNVCTLPLSLVLLGWLEAGHALPQKRELATRHMPVGAG